MLELITQNSEAILALIGTGIAAALAWYIRKVKNDGVNDWQDKVVNLLEDVAEKVNKDENTNKPAK